VRPIRILVIAVLAIARLLTDISYGQYEYWEVRLQDANNLHLSITNFGIFGNGSNLHSPLPSCEFPAGSLKNHLYMGALWIGAVVGNDTLVSTGYGPGGRIGGNSVSIGEEMFPCSTPDCGISARSNLLSSPLFDDSAKSDLEFIAEYSDTLEHPWIGPDWDGNPHRSLDLYIKQTSYSWSVGFAEDFILIDYDIRNGGARDLNDAYLCVLVISDVVYKEFAVRTNDDDMCGFKETYPSLFGPDFPDTLEIAWVADNDGDPEGASGEYSHKSVTSALGVTVLQKPKDDLKLYFNWISDGWGPMLQANARTFSRGGNGYPWADRGKLYLMANAERDYDQIFAARDNTNEGWLPPQYPVSSDAARGRGGTFCLSCGPFDIAAGESVPLTIAVIGGEDFHTAPDDFQRYMVDRYDPELFYQTLDFSDLADNALRAKWTFDNPGFDTDNDGYAGPYWEIVDTLQNGETVIDRHYYAGDGVPDFRPAVPPPPPVVRYDTEYEKITLRWNGLITETSVDPFSGIRDFEGYRIHMGRLNRLKDYARLASHDKADYWRMVWDEQRMRFEKTENPMTLDSIRSIYGQEFDPDLYPFNYEGIGYVDDTLTYCFRPMDFNVSIPGWDDGAEIEGVPRFRKTYAIEIVLGQVTDKIDIEDTLTSNNWVKDVDPITGDSVYYHKYYEYEYTIDGVLASVGWYFAVTAFDFGDVYYQIEPLETSPLANSVEIWAVNDAQAVVEKDLDVQVYPNPYIGDGRYNVAHYEDPYRTGHIDHERRIHFANLPLQCTIHIYTLDGDHVVKLKHPGRYSDGEANLTWNVRSKNNELVVSGIYIFVVESEGRSQIGKIVIIR
jgi:hypothetical protein